MNDIIKKYHTILDDELNTIESTLYTSEEARINDLNKLYNLVDELASAIKHDLDKRLGIFNL